MPSILDSIQIWLFQTEHLDWKSKNGRLLTKSQPTYIIGFMIPGFDENGYLPSGIHTATLSEVEARFSATPKRKRLFEQLKKVLALLKKARCSEVYLNGSFVTAVAEPNDYDLCWEPTGVIPTEELKQFLEHPEKRKEKYLGDIFPRLTQPPYHFDHVERWQFDEAGTTKGIIRIVLR